MSDGDHSLRAGDRISSIRSKFIHRMSEQKKGILLCDCQGGVFDPGSIGEIRSSLEPLNARCLVVSDLCGMVAVNPGKIKEDISGYSELLVIGCYPRTMRLLLKQVIGDGINALTIRYINLQETEPEEVVGQVERFAAGDGAPRIMEIREDSGWPSWYPVIDEVRCTICGQCADFCLFGVYEKTAEAVKVVYPQGCKNQCPACARICPVTAIIFPKYKQGGAIGGSDAIDEVAEQKRQAQDIEAILGNDIYAALQKRKARRNSIIRENEMKRAIDERNAALQAGQFK